MEIAIIVNEDDEIIEYKDRTLIQTEDIYRVAALLITNSQGEYMLAQRSFSKKNSPGAWSFSAAGGVAKGESYDENIVRETREELGIQGIEMKKIF